MPANRVKTIRYHFDTNVSTLATNTTLGTATRFDFAAITLAIAETGSRTFQSVMLRMSFRDGFTVVNEITGVRMGIKLNAVAFADTDRSFTQTNTSDHLYDEWTLDVTSYFNTNFGAGASATCQSAIAVSMAGASTIGGNITAELLITYEFDDSVGTTRTKTIGIPIGSHSATLTTTQAELGSDGTNPPPASQIPALATYLPEASVAIQQAAIVFEGNDSSASTANLNPAVQIDAAAESVRGVVQQALQTPMVYRDIFIYDTTTFSTASTHAVKMRDTTTTSRFTCMGAILWVTYTYDKSTTTRMLNQALVPFTGSNGVDNFNFNGASTTGNVAADGEVVFAILDIQEPGTITIGQSVAMLRVNSLSTSGNMSVIAGTQTARTYAPPVGGSGEILIHHRGDANPGAWALARGENRLALKAYNVTGINRSIINHAWALVTYSSDVPAEGTEAGNRIIHTYNVAYSIPVTALDVAASGAGQIAPTFFAPWKLNAALLQGRFRGSAGGLTPQMLIQRKAGEQDGQGFWISNAMRGFLSELSSWSFDIGITAPFNASSLREGDLDPESTHRLLSSATQGYNYSAWSFWTIHNITFTVAGTVTVNGIAVADGKPVQIWTSKPNAAGVDVVTERTTVANTAGGLGGFTAQIPHNTQTVFAAYFDAPNYGASAPSVGGVGPFDISMGSGVGETVDPTITVISSPADSSSPLVVSIFDASGLALYQVTCRDRSDGQRLMVYSSIEGFVHPFSGRSTISGSGSSIDPYILTIHRRGRWPTGISLDVRVQAVDTQGNEVNS